MSSFKSQSGPNFLSLPPESWHIKQNPKITNLSERNNAVLTLNNNEEFIIDKFKTTARILCLKNSEPRYSFRNMFVTLEPDHLNVAFKYWIKLCQTELSADFEKVISGKGFFKMLNMARRDDGIIIAKGRIEQWNQMTYNELSIIHASHRIFQIICYLPAWESTSRD